MMKIKAFETLIERIIDRISINLREHDFDAGPYIRRAVDLKDAARFYAFYGITTDHPIHFRFNGSSLAGSFFLGKCRVDQSVLYKCDIRGDELKKEGETFEYQDLRIPIYDDETFDIRNSFLRKTLVHNFSHDPENLESFPIYNTAALNCANIHGAPVEGSFLGPFATIDLTSVTDCVIGEYAYVQTGELSHASVPAGRIWIRKGGHYEFNYQYDASVLSQYIRMKPEYAPEGVFMDFVTGLQKNFQPVYDAVHHEALVGTAPGSALSPYAVVKGNTAIGENVLVAQRAYLENAWLGKGVNAQENCYIIDSRLEGNNITAHGGKIICSQVGRNVFVGFNAFLRGTEDAPLIVGDGCAVMPHTIIDLEGPLEIPAGSVVWGYIRNAQDVESHCVPLGKLSKTNGEFTLGAMTFQGDGKAFVTDFSHRIDHILEANGAFFDGKDGRGHAQMDSHMAFNTIQPYPEGNLEGIYPKIEILP